MALKKAWRQIRSYIWWWKWEEYVRNNHFDYSIPADKISEEILLWAIKTLDIDAYIISEESWEIGNKNADYTFYIDPLDWSVNFSRSVPSFCIALGVYKKKEAYFALIYDLSADELFEADVGKGVFCNGEKIQRKNTFSDYLVHLEWFWASLYEEYIQKLKDKKIRVRTAGSGVLAFCYGVIGRGDGTILLENKPWDIAPWLVFAKETWCIVKEISGGEPDLTLSKQSIIAAPKEIFKSLFDNIL